VAASAVLSAAGCGGSTAPSALQDAAVLAEGGTGDADAVTNGGDAGSGDEKAACEPDVPCNPNGNLCQTGTLSCGTGQATCVPTGDVAEGTSCAAGICCGGACVDATSDSSACGPSCTICPPGSTCVNSQCTSNTVAYGRSTEFSPCGSTVGSFSPGDLLGQPVTVAEVVTVNALGVFGNQPASGVEGILALYSDLGGAPSALLAFTQSTDIVAGKNEIPLLTPTAVAAGAYWIVGQYSASASICTDNSTTNSVDFVAVTYGALPNPFGAATALRSIDINYYLVGTE
jgi:hypothetical protein